MSDHQRVLAIRAIAASRRIDFMREISDSILREPKKWPANVVHGVASDLFPSVLSLDELLALLQRETEAERKNASSSFSWAMRQIVEAAEPSSGLAVELRDALAALIWRSRNAEQ